MCAHAHTCVCTFEHAHIHTINTCSSCIIDLGDAQIVRELCLKQLQLLFDQTIDSENDDADAVAALERAVSSVSEALWSGVVKPCLDCVDWAETAVACARNLVMCCCDDVIGAANWQVVAMGNTIHGLEFDDDLLASSSGRRTFLRDCFSLQCLRSPTEVLTAACRAKYNAKMYAKTRGETAAAGALMPYCVLSGPTQLSFVNKRKSSAFKKALQPPMFHRFRDAGLGFLVDVVREFSGRAAVGDGENGVGGGGGASSSSGSSSSSSNAAPEVQPLPSANDVLTSIR